MGDGPNEDWEWVDAEEDVLAKRAPSAVAGGGSVGDINSEGSASAVSAPSIPPASALVSTEAKITYHKSFASFSSPSDTLLMIAIISALIVIKCWYTDEVIKERQAATIVVAAEVEAELRRRYTLVDRDLAIDIEFYNFTDIWKDKDVRYNLSIWTKAYTLSPQGGRWHSLWSATLYVNSASLIHGERWDLPRVTKDNFYQKVDEVMRHFSKSAVIGNTGTISFNYSDLSRVGIRQFRLLKPARVLQSSPHYPGHSTLVYLNSIQAVNLPPIQTVDATVSTAVGALKQYREKGHSSLPLSLELTWLPWDSPCRSPRLITPDHIVFCKSERTDWEKMLFT